MVKLLGTIFNLNAQDINVPKSTTSISQAFGVATLKLMVLVGALAVIFIIVGAIQMSLSTGNAKRVSDARDTIIYAIVGLVVSIGAYAIVSFVLGAAK